METNFDPTLFTSQDDAAEAAALFNQGKEAASQGNPVGTFQATLEEAILGRSQSSDKLQITYKLKILAGPMKDKVLMKYDGLGSEKQAEIAISQLARLGVDTKTLTFDKLPAILLDLQGKTIAISCKQNKEFYNIYFQKIITNVTPGTTTAKKGGNAKF